MAKGVYDPEFGRLHYAVLHEPAKITSIVAADRAILEATNATGENVLRWCALENRYDDVKLLRSLGSSIQLEAITEAIEMGNSAMLLLLLELGGQISESDALSSLKVGKRWSDLSRDQLRQMRSHLGAYGVHVDLKELDGVHF